MRGLILTLLLIVLPYQLEAITATNHDKKVEPPPIAMEEEEILETAASNSSDLGSGERQRRLIPYMTFYLTRDFNRPAQQNDEQPRYQLVPQKVPSYQDKYVVTNYQQPKYIYPASVLYQPKITYTPFLENNKLPGGFTPMRGSQPIRVQVLNSPPKEPNYSSIFDKLLQLKQIQKAPQYIQQEVQYQNTKPSIATQYFTRNYATPRPPTKFVTVQNYQPETRYKNIPPAKTYIHTYTPSTIDISNDNKVQNYENFESLKTYNQIPAPLTESEQVKIYQNYQEPSAEKQKYEAAKEYQNYQKPKEEKLVHAPINTYQTYQEPVEKQKNYEPVVFRPIYRQSPVKAYRPTYHQQEVTQLPQTENPNSLSLILKQLQQSNTLPQTLTPDNIDNSIKTLVQILNALKETEKFQRPIVVAQTEDTNASNSEEDYEDDVEPSSVNEDFPANTPEGGTPGKPGIDYPAYSLIPQTDFSCKKQRYKGFFGDPATSCQVWHYCDLNGGQASFLCPNGTIFSQVALTCDWWYNVKCSTTTQLYVLNERLYKYILPFTPKFPEDYSGPLVDRYLALKFAEMEEKMKNQKKGKTEKPTDDDKAEAEANKLEDVESEPESASHEHTTATNEEEIHK